MFTSDSGRLPGFGTQRGAQRKYWNLFFRGRNGRAVEWYIDWTHLQGYLAMLMPKCNHIRNSVKILVAGCGNSELSAYMYDVGWQNITNVDFSKVVIAEMLRLHVRSRPLMRWQVMNMAELQFADACFDLVLDKGSLDSVVADGTAARSYLSEVMRVLRPGGKYACVTVAHDVVLGLLLKTFRQGWVLNVHKILLVSNSSGRQMHPYLVYAVKSTAVEVEQVKCFFGSSESACGTAQMQSVIDIIEEENRLRGKGRFTSTSDVFSRLHQGRRLLVKLGKHYSAVVLDAKPDAEPPTLNCGVFLVPKSQEREWLFSSEEGQWQVVETAQAGRLILVTVDAQQIDNMDIIEQDLSPLVRPLLPLDCRDSDAILYMTSSDALIQRTLLEEIESPLTGTIHVEEVVLLSEDSVPGLSEEARPRHRHYRRLVFRRNPNLIQSEASLIPVKVDQTKKLADVLRRHSGNKKKLKAMDSALRLRTGLEGSRVDFSFLASEYHAGIISGLSLIAQNLEQWISAKEPRRAMIVGLGAGLLPMFVYNHVPVDVIQVVELDGVVGDLAKRHFGFVEDERMQLHISDGVRAVGAIARRNSKRSSLPSRQVCEENLSLTNLSPRMAAYTSLASDIDSEHLHVEVLAPPVRAKETLGPSHGSSNKDEMLHILIIDADSEDPSTGLSCPPAEFLEEAFLRSAREVIVDGGILAINVVSRASSPHITSIALLQEVFEEVYDLEIEENVNRVLFALPHHSHNRQSRHRSGHLETEVMEAARKCFERLAAAFAPWDNGPSLECYVNRLKRLK